MLFVTRLHSPISHSAANNRATDGFQDAAEWNVSSYSDHPVDTLEPLADTPNAFRDAAIAYLKVLLAMDEFLTTIDDARAGWIAVAIVLKLTSVRGLSVANIASQLGCSPTTISRYMAKFASMADLDSEGGVRFIRPGAGLNGDKPAAVHGEIDSAFLRLTAAKTSRSFGEPRL